MEISEIEARNAPRKRYYTPEDYLELERKAEFKSEYYQGEIISMAGGSPDHALIMANLAFAFGSRLRGTPCRAYSSELKVRTTSYGLFAYPDLTIICGDRQYHDGKQDVVTNPTVLVEVLSPSTEAFDRKEKFDQYRKIATLEHYLLVAQSQARIECFSPASGDTWLSTIAEGLDAELTLSALNITLQLSEIYEGVEFAPAAYDALNTASTSVSNSSQ